MTWNIRSANVRASTSLGNSVGWSESRKRYELRFPIYQRLLDKLCR
jgi:hypothetical protein